MYSAALCSGVSCAKICASTVTPACTSAAVSRSCGALNVFGVIIGVGLTLSLLGKARDSEAKAAHHQYKRLLQILEPPQYEEFLSVVKRYGLITFRLCMVFTALRCAGATMDSGACHAI